MVHRLWGLNRLRGAAQPAQGHQVAPGSGGRTRHAHYAVGLFPVESMARPPFTAWGQYQDLRAFGAQSLRQAAGVGGRTHRGWGEFHGQDQHFVGFFGHSDEGWTCDSIPDG